MTFLDSLKKKVTEAVKGTEAEQRIRKKAKEIEEQEYLKEFSKEELRKARETGKKRAKQKTEPDSMGDFGW